MTTELTTHIVDADLIPQVVDFLSKGYTDEDCYHIMPALTPEDLSSIKEQNASTILRGMRDYYLVTRMNDEAIDRIEALALEKLEGAMVLEGDPMKLLKIFQAVNAAKRRSKGEGVTASTVVNTTTINNSNVVSLEMPARLLKESTDSGDFETNTSNEVIRVGNTHMVTASNVEVLKRLEQRRSLSSSSVGSSVGEEYLNEI